LKEYDMMKRNLWTLPVLLLCIALLPAAAANAQGTIAGGDVTINVMVDGEYCGTGGVQCEGLGAPAAGNSGRYRILVQAVKPDFDPLTTLTSDSFAIGSSFIPAGGSVPQINTDCPSCFQGGGSGLYAVFVEPGGAGTWKAGTHVAQLQVSVAGITFYPLIKLTVE